MPSVKRNITPITGEEAGRTILLDLAAWADNVGKGRSALYGRKTSAELSDMLYGLQTNEDVKIYNEYRAIQDVLHQWWNQAESTSREATIEWLKASREIELIALAAVHDDPLLSGYKPERFLSGGDTLESGFFSLERYRHSNEAQCAAVRVLSEELQMPQLLALQRPLCVQGFEDCPRLIEEAVRRLGASGLDGAAEAMEKLKGLPTRARAFADPGLMRRARALMKQKKPLLAKLHSARNLFLGDEA